MEHEAVRKNVCEYLKENGIKAGAKGYRSLLFAIMEAVSHPEKDCRELFEAAAIRLTEESGTTISGKMAYKNAYYSINSAKNGPLEITPFQFIKECSVGLEE